MTPFFVKYEKTAIAALFVVSAVLIFANLGGAALWHDEANTAIKAKHLLATGDYNAWNGRNLYVGNNGKQLNYDLKMHAFPPFSPLPSAAGMALFGNTAFGARFFHAVIGALALLAFYALLRHDLRGAELARLRLFAFACLALGAQTILFMRNGRYFADAILFSILAFYFYRLYWRGATGEGDSPAKVPPFLWLALCGLATFLNFINHYTIGASFALAMAAWHFCYYARQTGGRHYAALGFVGLVLIAACLYVLWRFGVVGGDKPLEYDKQYPTAWLPRHLELAYFHFRDLLQFGWLPLWVAVWLAAAAFASLAAPQKKGGKKKKRKAAAAPAPVAVVKDPEMHAVWRYLTLALWFVFFSSVLSVQDPEEHEIANSRYYVSALPFLALVLGGALCRLARLQGGWQITAPVTGLAAAALLCSNLLAQPFVFPNLFTGEKLRLTLPPLLAEVSRPRPTATQEVVDFLRQNAAQDETIFVHPWQDRDVLLFYLNEKLIFCCDLNERADLPQDKVDALGVPAWRKPSTLLPRWYASFEGEPPPAARLYEQVFVSSMIAYPSRRPELETRTFFPFYEKGFEAVVYRLK